MSGPPKTVVNWLNESDWEKYKERRRFESWRQKGHFYFDKIWNEAKVLSREDAYKWLAEKLGVPENKAHFRNLDKEQCKKAIWICQQLLNDLRRLDLDFGDEPITPFYIL